MKRIAAALSLLVALPAAAQDRVISPEHSLEAYRGQSRWGAAADCAGFFETRPSIIAPGADPAWVAEAAETDGQRRRWMMDYARARLERDRPGQAGVLEAYVAARRDRHLALKRDPRAWGRQEHVCKELRLVLESDWGRLGRGWGDARDSAD